MASRRNLIVNADDFGQSPGVNQGIVQSFEQGIVTSASLMVRWPAALAAAEYARKNPRLSIGLHVDLGEWAFRDGEWRLLYSVVSENDAAGVAEEVSRQLDQFRSLMGGDPSHIDSHQHVHRGDPLRSILIELSRHLRIPLRHFSEIHYCGDFYGQLANGLPYPEGLSADRLMKTLAALDGAVTELGCHPGMGDDVDSMYRTERSVEQKTLCDPMIREFLSTNRIELCSFAEFGSKI